jgi:hypothetical protein
MSRDPTLQELSVHLFAVIDDCLAMRSPDIVPVRAK